MWSRRRYFYCYSENPVVLYFLLRFIILITLGNRHKVSLLNENHKFSVEILKPRAWQESFTGRASKKILDCDQPPLVWGTSFHARFTRGRRFESDLGLFRLNSQEAMVRAHFWKFSVQSHMYTSLTTVILWPFSSFFQTENDQAKKGISASRNSTQQTNF